MKIFIELPTWLGDTIMTTASIENLVKEYPNAQITFFGSYVSIQALRFHPNTKKIILDNSRDKKFYKYRLLGLKDITTRLKDEFDLAISFRRTITSKILLWFIKAKKKIQYKRYTKQEIHQVIRYNDFLIKNRVIKSDFLGDLKLYCTPKIYSKPTLGINPGATYGSAKRWNEMGFAQVAKELSDKYDIVIFGSINEFEIAQEICNLLDSFGVKNYKNRAGSTSVNELIEEIAGLEMFITNDSGPMHIAAAFKIPTIAIFGPTKDTETSMWNNENGKIIKKDLSCMPCMKRVCPLGHHNCMNQLTSKDVLTMYYQYFKNQY